MIPRGATRRAALTGPAVGLVGQVVLLASLAGTVGLGGAGWLVGAACGVALDAALARALLRGPAERLGPAGWVTLARATLAVGVAALTADSFFRPTPVGTLVALAAVAIALDFADGQIARRTGTTSDLGARMDGEVDAFLIAALSMYVAPAAGAWVLAIGVMRYAFLVAGWWLAWMRAPLPPRYWRKVVAAVQGIALAVAAADVLPSVATRLVLAAALALLAESFGRDVLWLWRRRDAAAGRAVAAPPAALAPALTVLALLVVWAALVAPDQPQHVTLGAFARIPLEVVLVVAAALVLPRPARRALVWAAGPLLGLTVLVKLLDLGFYTAFDRPFDPFDDWRYATLGVETLRDGIGRPQADLVLVGVLLVVAAALVLPALALRRLARAAAAHRRPALLAVAALGVVWAASWAAGADVPAGPVASTAAADVAVREVRAVRAGFRDRETFAGEIRRDRYRYAPGDRLLTALRGKDVLLVFVESYGKVALEHPSIAPGVTAVLADGTERLRDAGFAARSGWLTSPTFGGISWLAHSTLQSGVWVDTQSRYDQLVRSERFTLSQAFGRAGWRVVAQVPANDREWPEGSAFYDYDQVYDRRHVGYRGPAYAYAPMPDQYTLLSFQRQERERPGRPRLFAEIDLVSSHTPWTRVPPLIDWEDVGDGSIFQRLPVDENGVTDPRRGYGRAIAYSLRTVVSYLERYGSDDLVVVLLGDHQPSTTVTGHEASHDVPVSLIARDPAVLDRIAGWGWEDGLQPGPAAPVWPMHAFRDRFLSAFGSRP